MGYLGAPLPDRVDAASSPTPPANHPTPSAPLTPVVQIGASASNALFQTPNALFSTSNAQKIFSAAPRHPPSPNSWPVANIRLRLGFGAGAVGGAAELRGGVEGAAAGKGCAFWAPNALEGLCEGGDPASTQRPNHPTPTAAKN